MRPSVLLVAVPLLALAACAAPPPPAWAAGPRPAVLGPFNGEPWVSTQSPPGRPDAMARHAPFQTPNSLPPGAWTTPGL